MLLAMLALAAITYPAFGGKSKGTPSDSYVAAHFAQSGYDIPVNPKWPVWGNPKAKVTIIEFSEFQCPYCRMSSTHFRPYLYEFRDKVRYYFVNFPLDSDCNPYARSRMHPQACVAARAAVCADRFGDFWDYHDEMFRNAKKLNKSYVLKLGEQFGWDPAEFQACMDDPSTEKWIKDDCELANKLHITGTPTIFVNNKRLRNWNDKDFVRAVIKEEIKRSY